MYRTELKPARHKAKLTQEQFAKMCNVSRKVISDIERGVGNPSLDTWERIVSVIEARLNGEASHV